MDVTPGRVATLAAATAHLDLGRREDLRAAARTVLVGRREHRELFDRAFDLFWRAPDPLPLHRVDLGRQRAPVGGGGGAPGRPARRRPGGRRR